MTLILALGNNEQVIQISDRRLSRDGRLVDDESNKCGVIFSSNARLAFGYTGLACFKNFITPDWLLQALHDSAPPEFTIGETLERLKTSATETFLSHPDLRMADSSLKRLAVMFSGYINLNGTFRQGCAILSNYHDFENNTAFPRATDQFNLSYTSATEGVEWPTLVQRVGNWRVVTDIHISELRMLLSQRKPADAIVGKAITLIREIADNPKSEGVIGKQLTSITIPYDNSLGVATNYYSHYEKPETYMPMLVYLQPETHMTVSSISVTPVDPDTPPLSVPVVGKNHPCPCGSTMKYKHCHGKTKKQRSR